MILLEKKTSIRKTCELLGIARQTYYRSIWRVQLRNGIAQKVLALVDEKRKRMPKIGGLKLYHLLKDSLKELGVGRDKLFLILRKIIF